MRLDQLLVEAKLTESDFQSARFDLVSRYRDLETVFDLSELPCRNGRYCSYQLIRGTLAAYATGASFCVFCDARRPDLVEAWYRVMLAVSTTSPAWKTGITSDPLKCSASMISEMPSKFSPSSTAAKPTANRLVPLVWTHEKKTFFS